MNPSIDDLQERRAALSSQIARQRGELAQAYLNLAKPIHYAEYGLRGFGFLRKNPWVFVALPSVVSILTHLIGLRKKKTAKPAPKARVETEGPKAKTNPVVRVAGYAWQLYKFYRRVRPHFM
jgi:hypothetical protein